jgi:hypothetical protein
MPAIATPPKRYTGRAMKIVSARIEVSTNDLIAKREGKEVGYYFHLAIKAILPGCRKVATISESPFAHRIVCRNLYSYNGSAQIHPEDWREFCLNLPVVSDRISPATITPELAKEARHYFADTADCPAVLAADCSESFIEGLKWDTLALESGSLA